MAHVDLRPLADDDADGVFELMREPDAVATASFTLDDPSDRVAFDGWLARTLADPRVSWFVVTEDARPAGVGGTFSRDGDREVTLWIAPDARGRGIADAAVRLLVAGEAERPLYTRVAGADAASIAAFEHNGFAEISRSPAISPDSRQTPRADHDADAEVVLALMPTLDGV